jgi:hypothetical protein
VDNLLKEYFNVFPIDSSGMPPTSDPIKIKVVAKWPILKDKMEVKSFLGLVSYYR